MSSGGLPIYTGSERRVDAVFHALGGCATLAGIVWIVCSLPPDGEHILAAGLYILGAVAMFGCSALYNVTVNPRLKPLFQRFDHAAIFLMIAGTYTPLTILSLRGTTGLVLLVVVWSVALVGAGLKLAWPNRYNALAIAAYVGLGWAGAAVLPSLIRSIPPHDLWLILAGGLIYMVGVPFHLWQSLPYQNAIWHGFVLTAAATQFAAVLDVIQS